MTVNPAGAADLASCGVSSPNNLTAAAGYTSIATALFSPTTSMYRVLTAPGAQTAIATISSGADMICGTYSLSGGPAPDVISAVNATNITSTSATITWTTSQAATSQVEYGTTAAYGSLTTLNSSLVTSHSVTLSGLTPGTTYNYAVLSANSSNVLATSANFIFTTPTPAPVISAVSVTNITSTSATVTWTTDQTSNSQVEYGTTASYGSLSTLNNALVTSHSVTITGLTPGTTYNYAAVSTNASGIQELHRRTSRSRHPLSARACDYRSDRDRNHHHHGDHHLDHRSAIQQPSLVRVDGCLWFPVATTHHAGDFALGGDYGSDSGHHLRLCGAIDERIRRFDYIRGTSRLRPRRRAPVISAVTAASTTSTTAIITWTTDQASNSQVKYGTTTSYGSLSTLNGSLVTSHSVTLMGLTPGTTYNYAVLSANAAGTQATSGNFTFATTASIGGAIAVTGNTCANWTYSNSTSCNWTPNSPSAGNSIHCFVFNFSSTTGFSVTDNAGTPNAYAQNGSTYIGTANGGHYALFDALSVTDGSLTRTTVNLSGSGSFFGLSCYEASGGSEIVDGPVATGSASNGVLSANLNPANSGDLASCGISSSNSLTAGAGYTAIAPAPFSPTTSMYRVLTASGAQEPGHHDDQAAGPTWICGTYSTSTGPPPDVISAVTATNST